MSLTHLGGDKQIVEMSPTPPICLFFTNVLMVLNCPQVMLKKSSSRNRSGFFDRQWRGNLPFGNAFFGSHKFILPNERFRQFFKVVSGLFR